MKIHSLPPKPAFDPCGDPQSYFRHLRATTKMTPAQALAKVREKFPQQSVLPMPQVDYEGGCAISLEPEAPISTDPYAHLTDEELVPTPVEPQFKLLGGSIFNLPLSVLVYVIDRFDYKERAASRQSEISLLRSGFTINIDWDALNERSIYKRY